jgi:hypothetical protein
MSDEIIAGIGRKLAAALIRAARSREQSDKSQVSMLQMELCGAYRTELKEQEEEEGNE